MRAGRPDSAMVVYERLVTNDAAGAALALDAAEMMLDNGYLDHARALLVEAGDLARQNGRDWVEHRARELIDQIPSVRFDAAWYTAVIMNFEVIGGDHRDRNIRSRLSIRELPSSSAHLRNSAVGENARESLDCDSEDGSMSRAEIHWYEAHGIGKVEIKIKRFLED